jgi:hypothetical protein
VCTALVVIGTAVSYAVAQLGSDDSRGAVTETAKAAATTAASVAPGTTPPRTRPAATTKPAPESSGAATAYADLAGVQIPWVGPVKVGLNDPVIGTTNLQPPMAAAYERAEAAARKAGHRMSIRSGWRSPEWQQVLFDRAVAKYGSPAAARRWVLPPEDSAHVLGLAVDVRPEAAARWLEREGAAFGLCRRYENEWWHFELTDLSGGRQCPPLVPTAGG